jgi:hypothetical protein
MYLRRLLHTNTCSQKTVELAGYDVIAHHLRTIHGSVISFCLLITNIPESRQYNPWPEKAYYLLGESYYCQGKSVVSTELTTSENGTH